MVLSIFEMRIASAAQQTLKLILKQNVMCNTVS